MMFHGFKRSPGHLRAWRERLPGVAFGILPGHAGAPALADVSVEAWAEAWREAFDTMGAPPVLVGESLGALLALALPSRAVVAVEPLLSVDQIWPQHEVMARARARGVPISAEDEALFGWSYDWILDRISAPALVIAGRTPLLPPRQIVGPAPSLLTDADFNRYAAHPLVQAVRIPGGHTLMDENPDGVAGEISVFLPATLRQAS
jgi:pimeloyl-ACP methyl ester carboxylesterase